MVAYDYMSVLAYVMVWFQIGNKPLPETILFMFSDACKVILRHRINFYHYLPQQVHFNVVSHWPNP